jgi:hypothetical protein
MWLFKFHLKIIRTICEFFILAIGIFFCQFHPIFFSKFTSLATLQHFSLTSLLVCLSVCYKSHNRYLTHFYLSNRSEILHTCVKLVTMHESIGRINNFEKFKIFIFNNEKKIMLSSTNLVIDICHTSTCLIDLKFCTHA